MVSLQDFFGPTLTIRSILKNGDGNLLYGPENSTSWFYEDNWHHTQYYVEDTNI